MEAQLTLWGIYGEIEGDRDALISHLPLFRCDTLFYAALTPDWTLTTSTLLKLESPDEAALVGTSLKLTHSTTINPGQILAVMGPDFVQSVETLGVFGNPFFTADDWLVAQDGFRVRCTTRTELDEHWERLTLQALHVFDAELREAVGRSVSQRASAALGIFRISPFCNRDQRFWRVATARRIKGDADGYNRSVLLAAAELKRPFAELDEEVRSWVRTILCEALEEPKFRTFGEIVASLRQGASDTNVTTAAWNSFLIMLQGELQRPARDPTRDPTDRFADVISSVEEALSTDVEDLQEQRVRQEHFPDLKEVWVVARNFLDLGLYYETVKSNIEKRRVTYVYFQLDRSRFNELTARLKGDVGDWIKEYLWCVIAPPSLFMTDVVIFNPGEQNMIGWVNRLEKGQTKRLYQMDQEQLDYIYKHVVQPVYPEYEKQKKLELSNGGRVIDVSASLH
jgi:hypothetical protein